MALYVVAKIVVKYGMLAEYEALQAEMLDIFEPHGWTLLASYQTIFGDVNEVFHIWEVEDANKAVLALDDAGGESPFQEAFMRMRELTDSEHISLVRKSPYSR